MASTRIAELAATIHSNTTKLDDYLKTQGIKSPSFDVDTPDKLDLPPDIAGLREGILEATDELHHLIQGPVQYLTGYNYNSLISLQLIERLNIATSFPINGSTTFNSISQKCNLNLLDTQKILRQAMSHYVFRETPSGHIVHTSISRQIAENPLMRDWIAFMCDECWRCAPRVADAMLKWPESQEPAHTAWVLANNAEAPLTQEIFKYPGRFARMPGAMQMSEKGDGLQPGLFVEAFDWSGVRTVVDVGGAHGSMSIEIARKAPTVQKCIVQDLPFVLAQAKAPQDVAARVEFMPHDFFTAQVVKGADVYFFRWIFHDWSDKYAVRILQSLIPGLKKGARVVMNEFLLPKPGMLSPYQERPIRNFDLSMKQLMNSKERDVDGWISLLQAADPGFRLKGISMPPGSKLAIIEVTWEGESHSE